MRRSEVKRSEVRRHTKRIVEKNRLPYIFYSFSSCEQNPTRGNYAAAERLSRGEQRLKRAVAQFVPNRLNTQP